MSRVIAALESTRAQVLELLLLAVATGLALRADGIAVGGPGFSQPFPRYFTILIAFVMHTLTPPLLAQLRGLFAVDESAFGALLARLLGTLAFRGGAYIPLGYGLWWLINALTIQTVSGPMPSSGYFIDRLPGPLEATVVVCGIALLRVIQVLRLTRAYPLKLNLFDLRNTHPLGSLGLLYAAVPGSITIGWVMVTGIQNALNIPINIAQMALAALLFVLPWSSVSWRVWKLKQHWQAALTDKIGIAAEEIRQDLLSGSAPNAASPAPAQTITGLAALRDRVNAVSVLPLSGLISTVPTLLVSVLPALYSAFKNTLLPIVNALFGG